MATWGAVEGLENGMPVEASVLNKPITGLVGRTEYLKSMMEALGADGGISSVRFQVQLSETDTPRIGDIVCLDLLTKRFVKASASMSVFDVYTASDSAYAVGMLVEKDTGTNGIVASSGYVNISGPDFDIPSMLETGETFSNGVYYLSALEPGKITKSPKGSRIEIGFFTENLQVSSRNNGDFAVLSVQYGDLMSHRHRSYRLTAAPVGTPYEDIASPDYSPVLSTYGISGYAPDYVRGGGSEGNGMVPYLLLSGEWPAQDSVSYVIWLSRSSGTSSTSSPVPSTDFSDVYLHWSSSDSSEGSGMSKVGRFMQYVPIGTRGLVAALDPRKSNDLSSPYSAETDSQDLRTWTIRMPEYAKGWTQNIVTSTSDFSEGEVSVFGTLTRKVGEISVYAPENIYELPSENPVSGSEMVVGSTTFKFVGPDDEVEDGIVPVVIQGSGYQTFRSLSSPYASEAGYAIVDDAKNSKVYIGASSASLGGIALQPVAVGGGTIPVSGGSCNLFVCDEVGVSLVDSGYATVLSLSNAVQLNVGLKLCISASSTLVVPQGTNAILDASNGAPGAKFRYAIEMDEAFNSAYPPIPAQSGSLVWNGVEVESSALFGDSAVYSIGPDSLYWNDNSFGRVPWPMEWTDRESILPNADAQRLVFHYVSSFHSETGPVTSLHPADGSPIKIKKCGTNDPASVGDLELDLDLAVDVANGVESGYKAVKASRHGKLLLGPLVEKIVAGPGISLSQPAGQPSGQGIVTISATNASYSGEMDTIALENAKEEVIGMFPYVRLLGWGDTSTNIPTGFIAKFQIPTSLPDDVYRVKLYATVFGETSLEDLNAEQYAGVTMNYNILPDWTPISGTGLETASMNLSSDLIKPDHTVSADIPFGLLDESSGTYSYKAYDPVLIHNDPTVENVEGRSYEILGDPFPNEATCSNYLSSHTIGTSAFGVRPGYIVSVRFSRSAPSSGTAYTGKIGFINLRWALVRADEDETVTEVEPVSDASVILENLKRIASHYTYSNLRTVDQLRSALLVILNQLK